MGKTEGNCLCLGEKQQGTKWESSLYRAPSGWSFGGTGGFSNTEVGWKLDFNFYRNTDVVLVSDPVEDEKNKRFRFQK